MKAINIRNNARAPEALIIDDIPDPEVTSDRILVRISTFGLNRMDLTRPAAKYPMEPN